MLSDFVVAHPDGPYITLSDDEWNKALQKYPELSQKSNDVTYLENSATAVTILGKQPFFNNNSILEQFERIFKIIEFKDSFRNHEINILVERNHSFNQSIFLDLFFVKILEQDVQ